MPSDSVTPLISTSDRSHLGCGSRRTFLRGAGAATAIALLAPFGAGAQGNGRIRLNAFNSAANWPLWAARNIGAFDRQGLTIELTFSPDAKSQMSGLIEGKFDLATTDFDNVIAYSEGDDAAKSADLTVDLVAVLGGNDGGLTLNVQPEIKTVADLKGKAIAIDADATALWFVARAILDRHGIKADDVKWLPLGTDDARFVALQDGSATAALLAPPFTLIAPESDYPTIMDVPAELGGYQGLVSAVRRDWAKQHADLLVRYIRAYRAGLNWLLDAANKDAAIRLLVLQFPKTTPPLARASYEKMVATGKAFDPGAKLNLTGCKTVFDLRRRHGPQGKTIHDVSRFIDESYFNTAIKQ